MVRWNPLKGAFRRFGGSRRGSATVEFALVLLPFFLLTFGLAEISMIGFAQTSLDFATSETARQIRTGRAQLSGMSSGQIKAQLCSNFSRFMTLNCGGDLYIDVDTFNSFVAASNANNTPLQNGQLQTGGFGYTPGAPSEIVVVRTYYRWEVMTPIFQRIFANAGGTQRIIVSTMMFRNEPYQ